MYVQNLNHPYTPLYFRIPLIIYICVYVLFHYLSLGGDTSPTLDHFYVFNLCGLIQWFSEIISMLVMSR